MVALRLLCGLVGLFLFARADAAEPCKLVSFDGNGYTVCEADLRQDAIRLFWKKEDGAPYGFLQALPHKVDEHSGRLLFATNAGMFDPNYKPVGLYVENGRELVHLNTRSGSGNFHLKPNGVFFVAGDRVGVLETGAYLKQRLRPDLATQSGPMLVIDGKLHSVMARRASDEVVLVLATTTRSYSPCLIAKFRSRNLDAYFATTSNAATLSSLTAVAFRASTSRQ